MSLTNYSPSIDPRDIQTRKELIAGKETTQDMYTEDTLADPEGAARRAERPEYAPWALDNFQVSNVDFYGRPWEDGKMHLIPTKSHIQDVVDTYKMLMTDDSYMTACCELAEKDSDFETMKSAYTSLVSSVDNDKIFAIAKSVSGVCQEALARRAYDYHRYLEADAKANMQSDTAEMPDWVLNKENRAEASSRIAGIWYSIYKAVQNITGYKPLDFVNNIGLITAEKHIRKMAIDSAKWVDENGKLTSSNRVTSKESRLIKM
jgi:hypothetical protein